MKSNKFKAVLQTMVDAMKLGKIPHPSRIWLDHSHTYNALQHASSSTRLTVCHNWVMTFGLIPLLHEWRAATYSSLFLVPIIRICPSSGYSIQTCPFSPFPQHAHLMCFATSSQPSALRLPLTVEVRFFPPHSRPCSLSPLDAAPLGTVQFTSPLYRSNLHYKIIQKPSVSAQVVKSMVNYILERYPNETGIVYCLSRKVSQIPRRHCRALVS